MGIFKERGIIVNREVEIRRGTGSSKGERTDIHIDAVIRTPSGKIFDSISAIIEVKGCWHKELYSAMQTQLVNRYLKDNRCRYGLYLVGWFNCDQWDKKDDRKKQAPLILKSELQEKLENQAKDLSQNGLTIRTFVMDTALR